MRYCVGATSCQMQFLLGGYSLGQPGLVMEPFSFVMKPPQAAAHGKQKKQQKNPKGMTEGDNALVPSKEKPKSDVPSQLRLSAASS